jgi:nitrate reductase gamma subunit
MVYIAFAVFIIGTTIRLVKIFRQPKHPSTLQIFPEKEPTWLWALHDTFLFPSIRRHKPVLWVFLIVFHAALFFLIIGHLELLGDFKIFQIVPHEVFLGQGYIGLVLSLALLYFLFRRFISPVRELSVPEDYYLLILLFLIVLFGSQMDWARRWYGYEEMTVDDYRTYLQSLLFFKPELPEAVTDYGHSFMLVLHVFFCKFVFTIFPVQPEYAFIFIIAHE